MRYIEIPLLVAFGAAALWAIPAADAATSTKGKSYDEDATESAPFKWTGRLKAGQSIEIKGINGEIVADAATGTEVSVDARKRGRKSDPEDVKIEVVEHAGGVTICARYPRPDGGLNDCEPGDRNSSNTRNNDVEVDFKVKVPAGVALVARNVNGDIEANALKSRVDAATVNGSVHISTTLGAAATTVNGSISARMGRADWEGELEFATVNGGIRLELPQALDAEVSASTTNGSISTDYPLMVKGKFNSRRISGTIGRGGRELSLSTVNGSIQLRQID